VTPQPPRPSLDGPRAKLRRAHHHLEGLYDDFNRTVGPQQHSLVREDGDEPRTHIFRAQNVPPLPPDWGLIVGDFAHNLRSALDHLVWQLVLLSGSKPGRDNQFPICSAGTRYWCSKKDGTPSVRDRSLRGVAEQYRTPIDAVQPYRRGQDTELAFLSGLADLSNFDKHRVIQTAYSATHSISEEAFDVICPDDDAVVQITSTPGTRLEDGAEIARVRVLRPEDPETKVYVKANIPMAVGFGETRIPIDGLAPLYVFVRDFIESYAPAFEAVRGQEGAPTSKG